MALTDCALICANDYAENAVIFDAGDSGASGLPLTNLMLPDLYAAAEFSTKNPASTWFTVDLKKVVSINMVSLLKHNLTYVAKWRVRIYDADPDTSSAIYDSGLTNVFPAISGYGGLAWGEFFWGGSLEEYAEVNPAGFNRHSFLPVDTVFGRYVRIDIDDPTNSTLPKISRLWISKGYQPSFNISYGSSIEPIDETEVSKTRSGVRKYGRVVKRKSLNMIFELIPIREMLFNIFGPIGLRTGKANELLVLLNPAEPETWFFESCFGNMPDISAFDYSWWNRMGTVIKVDEAV